MKIAFDNSKQGHLTTENRATIGFATGGVPKRPAMPDSHDALSRAHSRQLPPAEPTPTFTWDAVDGAASYEVKMDSGDYTNIGNVTTYTWPTALADGSHTFYVRAQGQRLPGGQPR